MGLDKLDGHVSYPDGHTTEGSHVVAYVVPWGDMAAGRFLTGALRAGVKLKSADESIHFEEMEQAILPAH